eukprot:CAMPEP_0117450618 /NCGR_PEP_ID=MMETSP0759-20121206/8567_1 /TAXON_ID=63605 /ORGANISM="Percolomonas cosmopolitus, Strain WS" /LENGTH=431 /DNA_ID=CAMNT_0005243157 /DNA_START=119 /DNA_END=1414 /DNA_ORIENTATION=+
MAPTLLLPPHQHSYSTTTSQTTATVFKPLLKRTLESVGPSVLPKLVSFDKVINDSDLQIDKKALEFSDQLRSLINDHSTKHNITTPINPESFIKDELANIQKGILESINVSHPVLQQAASYFFQKSGKKFRPMIVLLLSKAVTEHSRQLEEDFEGSQQDAATQSTPTTLDINLIKKHHQKLAEITEIIHVASLIHDDIVDQSDMRRGVESLHKKMGSKVAVLAGDFLLARASINLSKMGNLPVIEAISTAIEHLAHGEILQMAKKGRDDIFDAYMQTIFFKTSSLISNSCKSAALLTHADQRIVEASYQFGKHIGIAYQLIDDVLDFTESGTLLGKPSLGADLRLGIATSPVLFASLEYPELEPMIRRKFSRNGDVDRAWELVLHTNSIEKSRDLAITHCKKAVESLMILQDSPYRTALIALVLRIMERNK